MDIGNILQSLGVVTPAIDQTDVGMPPPEPVAPPPEAPPPPPPAPPAAAPAQPHRRRSLLDTIGRISDVLAKVGGAEALYQPTLDAREDRTLKLGDHDRQVTSDELKNATDRFALGNSQNLRLGQAARGLKAIQTAGGDISKAWPVLAQRLQIDPDTTAQVGQGIAADPNSLDGLIAATTDPKYDQSKYGGTVVYGMRNGKLVAFQPSLSSDSARNILPDDVTPIDPPKAVDVGGSQVVIGTRSGNPVRVLPKTERPGFRGGVPINERPGFRGGRPIAPPPTKAGTGPDPAMIATAQGNLDELRSIYRDLHKMGAMVSPAQAANKNVVARIRASGIGQTLEGAIGTQAQTQRDRVASIRPQLMQSLAKATGMTGKQLDSNADVKLFMQTVTNPATSYEANMKAIDGLERFLKANGKNTAAVTPVAQPAKKSGWSIVGVK